MAKDKKITAKCAFYKARRKRGLTNEAILPLWEIHLKQEVALRDAEDEKQSALRNLKARRVEEAKVNAEKAAKRKAEEAKLAAEEAKKAEVVPAAV